MLGALHSRRPAFKTTLMLFHSWPIGGPQVAVIDTAFGGYERILVHAVRGDGGSRRTCV